MKAFSLIRPGPEYRRDAFAEGLKAIGYQYCEGWQGQVPGKDDLLLIWNRYASFDFAATAFEKAGATVLVAENGYIGKDPEGRQYYALAKNGHNGSGSWHIGAEDRWLKLGIPVRPLREDGRHILVCGQRNIGAPGMASPVGWEEVTARKLRTITRREVRIRHHPEHRNQALRPKTTLEEDLNNAWACVIWSSGAGVKALVSGIPVFYEAPHWVCSGAASRHIEKIEHPAPMWPVPTLRKMAWGQWSPGEITSGLPFRYLLGKGQGTQAA